MCIELARRDINQSADHPVYCVLTTGTVITMWHGGLMVNSQLLVQEIWSSNPGSEESDGEPWGNVNCTHFRNITQMLIGFTVKYSKIPCQCATMKSYFKKKKKKKRLLFCEFENQGILVIACWGVVINLFVKRLEQPR